MADKQPTDTHKTRLSTFSESDDVAAELQQIISDSHKWTVIERHPDGTETIHDTGLDETLLLTKLCSHYSRRNAKVWNAGVQVGIAKEHKRMVDVHNDMELGKGGSDESK